MTGTLATPFDWGWEVEYERTPRVFRYDSGHVYRIARDVRARRSWSVKAATLGATDRATLVAFWASHNGSEVPFAWTTPDDESVTGCFDQDTLGDRLIGPGLYAVDLRILELFA